MARDLMAKYDVPVPRYTSYPTVPQWHRTPVATEWLDSIARVTATPGASLALYVHVPFCESLCTFCGCNTVITRDHGREDPYIDLVLAELDRYLASVPSLASLGLRQLHLGGGTPTFLHPTALARLIDGLIERFPVQLADLERGIEVDPRVTSRDHLDILARRGFGRISLGVQDVDRDVQQLVNRIQPLELTAELTRAARELDYASVNFDLIYGLPGQTRASMARLASEVVGLRPDRLAVYSFALVPWIKPAQRKFRDDDVPVGDDKRALYEIVRDTLLAAGYVEIGLDHFALPDDALAHAASAGTLHRNFMGYTDVHTTALLGLGVSAISETPDCYHQNEKIITRYERRVRGGEIPTLRGHLLSEEDQRRRAQITDLMTSFSVELSPAEVARARTELSRLIADEVVLIKGNTLSIPDAGRPFLRNAASFFDEYLDRTGTHGPLYSTTA
jgi:oxygen-independent coproporphyrinogen-3 oxidase